MKALHYIPQNEMLFGLSDRQLFIWENLKQPPTIVIADDYFFSDLDVNEISKKILLACGKQIRILNYEGKELQRYEAHSSAVSSCDFYPSGTLFLTTSHDGTCVLWDLNSQKIMEFKGHAAEIYSSCFHPTSPFVVTGSRDNTLKVWSLTRMRIWSRKGHQFDVTGVSFVENDLIISSGYGGELILWENGIPVYSTQQKGISSLKVADEKKVWVGDYEGIISQYLSSGDSLRSINNWNGHNDFVQAIDWNEKYQVLITLGNDKMIKLWDEKGILKDSIPINGKGNDIEISSNGELLAIALDSADVLLYSFITKKINSIPFPKPIQKLTYSNDGKYLLATYGNQAVLLNLKNPKDKLPVQIRVPNGIISAISFSPNNDYFLTGSWDNSIRIWNLKGEEVLLLSGHDSKVLNAKFSPDGQTISSGDLNGVVIHWHTIEHLIKTKNVFFNLTD